MPRLTRFGWLLVLGAIAGAYLLWELISWTF
jgi:hypothetical protein